MRALLLVASALLLVGLGVFLAAFGEREDGGAVRELDAAPTATRKEQVEVLSAPAPEPVITSRVDAAGPVEVAGSTRVAVASRTSRSRNAEPVPNTAVVLGVGWSTGGPRGTSPIPGEFPDLRGLRDRTALVATRTDSTGSAVVELDIPAELASADRVWVEVVEPGHCRRVSSVEIDGSANELSLRVVATPGWTLRGRVVDEAGALVPGSRMEIHRAEGADGSTRQISARCRTGHIEVHRSGPWGVHHVLARREQVGLGVQRDIPFDPELGPPVVEIVLRGEGRITGMLVDPTGRPLTGQPLWALPYARRQERSVAGYTFERGAVWEEGLIETQASTDASGIFDLRGLRPGEYAIRGQLGVAMGYDHLLTERPVRSGSEGLRLVVPLHRLRIRVTDGAGRPIAPNHELSAPDSKWWSHLPQAVFLYVHEATEAGTVVDPRRLVEGRHVRREDGRLDVKVAPGLRYLVGGLSTGRSLVEREVFVGPTDWLVEVELPMREERPSGRLVVEVQDPAGHPFGSRHTSVQVFAPESGKLLCATPRSHFESRFEVPLPEGRYRVVAGAPSWRGQHGGRAPEKYLPIEEWVHVPAGGTVDLNATVREGGRLRLTVDLEGEAEAIGHAEVFVRPEHGGPEQRPIFGLEPGIVSLPKREKPHVPIGRATEQLDALPPGRWIVRVEREGYVTAEASVDVVGGEVTPVEVTLERE